MTENDNEPAAAKEKATKKKATKKRATKKRATKKRATKKKGKSKAHPQVAASALPRVPLSEAIRVAEIVHRNYAGKAAEWDDIAKGLELAPNTPRTKYLIWSAGAYGVVEKGEGKQYKLSETGRKIVAPTYDGEDGEGRKKAILTPSILSKFFSDYDGHPLPESAHFSNVLETKYEVPRSRTAEAAELIQKNGDYAGVLVEREGLPTLVSIEGRESGFSTATGGTPAPADVTSDAEIDISATDWSKVCFYVTPLGSDGTEIRKHADMMLRHLVEPVTEASNLIVVRADTIGKSGLITQQIFEHLARSRLCVADLSFSNPNAFYELGVRHMCKLPTIQIIRKGDKIPFDVSQGRTIMVDTSDVYTIMDRLQSARRELQEHVTNALSDNVEHTDNPVDIYLPGLKVSLPQ